jgi:polyisoprenoid-binding protein YceI
MRTLIAVLLLASACSSKDSSTSVQKPALTGPQVPAPAIPARSKWVIDSENSSANFVCKHVFSNVRGMIHQPSGTVVLDEANPAKSSVNATLAMGTIDTGVPERDTHLKSADFFDAAQFPNITFVSKSFSGATGAFTVTGDLTMHGVTKSVTLSVVVSQPFNHAGGVRRGLEATTTVNRRDFGVLWDFPGEGTGVVVGDTILITIDFELVLEG